MTIYLNDCGVLLATRTSVDDFTQSQRVKGSLVNRRATLRACSVGMDLAGVKATELLSGVMIPTPEQIERTLSKDQASTLA